MDNSQYSALLYFMNTLSIISIIGYILSKKAHHNSIIIYISLLRTNLRDLWMFLISNNLSIQSICIEASASLSHFFKHFSFMIMIYFITLLILTYSSSRVLLSWWFYLEAAFWFFVLQSYDYKLKLYLCKVIIFGTSFFLQAWFATSSSFRFSSHTLTDSLACQVTTFGTFACNFALPSFHNYRFNLTRVLLCPLLCLHALWWWSV